MFDIILDILKFIVVISGVIYTISIYRQAQGKHPVFRYDQHSDPNQAEWRWRQPDGELGFKLEDDDNKSCLHLPLHLLSHEKWCIVIGYLASLFTIFLYATLIMRDAGLPEYLIGLIFVMLSYALFLMGSRVSSIALYPDHLVVIENYGFFLKKIFIYKHSQRLTFKGKSQFVFELTLDHKEPDFKLYIKRKYWFVLSSQNRFIISVNQSQGSWLVGGLDYWRDHAGLVKK